MGNLLRLLAREDSSTCLPNPVPKYDLFLDFENAMPSPSEMEVFQQVEQVLCDSQKILEEISQYKGASKEIREAINNPNKELLSRATAVVFPLVLQLKRFHDFTQEIVMVIPKILGQLCSSDMTPTKHLEQQQALVKQFAEILEFVLKFDEYKMTTPAIQNDFSYYRRLISRQRTPSTDDIEEEQPIDEVQAMGMSMFYAQPTPMLTVLRDATVNFLNDNKDLPIDNTTETLRIMTRVCQRMLEDEVLIQRFKREETHWFVLRVMVGLIILYDHVHPVGAFGKSSNIDVKGCVRVLKEQPMARSESLLNALRYTTRHLNDVSTPKHIKTLLAK